MPGADWPVGLPSDRPMGPPKIIITFLNFAIKWQLVLFGRGPLLLPKQIDFLKISGCRMSEKITLRNLSTEKAFSKNVGPHVSMKDPEPRAHCP